MLAALVQLAGSLLTGQAGETELHTVICTRLLPVLVRRRGLCHTLVQQEQWQNLAGQLYTPVLC